MSSANLETLLSSTNKILLIVPSDKDYAAIYTAISLATSFQNSSDNKFKSCFVLSDALAQDKLLINNLNHIKYKPLHSKSFQLFSINIDKSRFNLQNLLVDESQDKVSISFEAENSDLDLKEIISVRPPLTSFDMIISLSTEYIHQQQKYLNIINQIGENKLFKISSKYIGLETKEIFEKHGYELDNSLIIKSLAESNTPANIINNHKLMKFLYNNLNDVYGIQDALISSERLTTDDIQLINLADSTYQSLGNGIYCSIISDPTNILKIPRYLHSKFFDLHDCTLAFIIIERHKANYVFVKVPDENFIDKLPQPNNIELIKDCIIFKSTSSVNDIKQELIRTFIKQTITSEKEVTNFIYEPKGEGIVEESHKFTQGLSDYTPLKPAVNTHIISPKSEPINNSTAIEKETLIEEC
jgi:hypothetical protein